MVAAVQGVLAGDLSAEDPQAEGFQVEGPQVEGPAGEAHLEAPLEDLLGEDLADRECESH